MMTVPRVGMGEAPSGRFGSSTHGLRGPWKSGSVANLRRGARERALAGGFTAATSGGTASNAGVDDLLKELQDAGARLAAEVKAETQK